MSGTQCFTTDDFQAAYDAAPKTDCNTTAAVMTCYSFEDAESSGTRRMGQQFTEGTKVQDKAVDSNRRDGDQLTAVRCITVTVTLSRIIY